MPHIEVLPDGTALAEWLCTKIAECISCAVAERGACSLGFSGGSLLSLLAPLAERKDLNSPDSNAGQLRKALLDHLPGVKLHAIDEAFCADEGDAAAAAADLDRRMRSLPESVLPRDSDLGLPMLDCVALGIGPDGHVASLFPGHPLLSDSSGNWVLPITDSPKPPAKRVTLSVPVLCATRRVVFAVAGAGKTDALKAVLERGDKSMPAAKLLAAWEVVWLLDEAAAKPLTLPPASGAL